MQRIFSLLVLLMFTLSLSAQDLRRKGNFGFVPAAMSAEEQSNPPCGQSGLSIQQVLPASVSEQMGLRSGDILMRINDQTVSDMQAIGRVKTHLRDGDALTMLVCRRGKKITLTGKMMGKAREVHPKADILYDVVQVGDLTLRAIVSKPKRAGRFPVIYFIPGYTCVTLDNLQSWHPYRRILDSLMATEQYVIVRVEKPGMGDSEGDCMEIGFETELNAFRKGFEHLLTYDFVDQKNVFIFGHSLGGMIAPIIAAERKDVRGIAVYGTRHEPWFEYLPMTIRQQNPRFGTDYLENERDMRAMHRIFAMLFLDRKHPQEIAAADPAYGPLLQKHFGWDGKAVLIGRHASFLHEIEDHNMVEAWGTLESKVLLMHGEADIQALGPDGAQEILRIVNHYHPGQASFKLIEGTDHGFIKLGSLDKSYQITGKPEYGQYLQNAFNYEVVDTLLAWLAGQTL
ncbi:MAG: alpha/beta fold hydrolase [Bacteroidota bacterium]